MIAEDDFEPSEEEHEDVMRLIAHAFSIGRGPAAAQKQHLVAGLAAIVKAKYGALEHKRHRLIADRLKQGLSP